MYFGYPYKPDVVLTQVVGQLFDSLNNVGVNARVRLVDPETGEVVAESATDAQGNYNLGVPNGKNKKYNMDIKFAGVNPPKPAQKAVLGKENLLMGSVIDGVTGEALQATIDLLDPATGAILDNAITNKGSGKYFVPIKSGMEYQIRVKAPQYIAYFEKLQVSASGTFDAHNYEIALQRVNDANRIVLNWQFFDYGKWELNTLYSDDLDNLMIVMQKVPVLRIKIAGHTDWDGSPSYNQKLSEKRAQAVKEFLVKKGIDKSRIEVEGKGELQPLYDNENPNLKPWNRRVELFILN